MPLVVVVREVHRAELRQVGELLLIEDVLGDIDKLLGRHRRSVERFEGAAQADDRRLAGLDDQVRGLELDGDFQEVAEARCVRVVRLVGIQVNARGGGAGQCASCSSRFHWAGKVRASRWSRWSRGEQAEGDRSS